MGVSVEKLLILFGLFTLLHSAYSAAQHRVYLRLTEKDFTSLPADILIQTLAGLILTCCGIVKVFGKFREIKATAELEKRTWETLNNRPAFYTFNHRGKTLYGTEVHHRSHEDAMATATIDTEDDDS